jgi:hypothetical protein
MGETRVDLLHLLEDLAEAYADSLEETIVTEVVANSLDSGATRIAFRTDASQASFVVADDGSGMSRRELARYHDVAASTKAKGEGIGFAGVGIKLGLLLSEEVVTETRRGHTQVATSWRLASQHRAPWRWIDPPGLLADGGTAVRLKLRNTLSPLLDAGFIEATVRRHFQPLLDAAFDQVLAGHYPHGVRFLVNGGLLAREGWVGHERAGLAVRLARRRKPAGVGFLERDGAPLPEERRGLAVSTLGKVIKRGWDWLGVAPAAADRIGGLIEVPELAACLTLNKSDFLRSGPRGLTYVAYRKALQEAVSAQLAAWGDAAEEAEPARRRVTRPIERDLETVLVDLADQFPLLAALVERHLGGQRRLPVGGGPEGAGLAAASVTPGEGRAPEKETVATATPEEPPRQDEPARAEPPSPEPPSPAEAAVLPGAAGRRRPARYGLRIQFESRPDDDGLARLAESTVWVNEAHPAYRRAVASRAEGYHLALAVAMALASVAVEPAAAQPFVSAFLARWGDAVAKDGRRRRR